MGLKQLWKRYFRTSNFLRKINEIKFYISTALKKWKDGNRHIGLKKARGLWFSSFIASKFLSHNLRSSVGKPVWVKLKKFEKMETDLSSFRTVAVELNFKEDSDASKNAESVSETLGLFPTKNQFILRLIWIEILPRNVQHIIKRSSQGTVNVLKSNKMLYPDVS